MLPHIYKDGGTIAISLPNGEMKMIDTAHINYDEIVAGMKAGEDDKVISLINIAQQIERSIRASADTDNVKIIDGEVLFQGEPIHNSLTTRIITMADEGFDIVHMVRFLENLMMNPSYRAVNELYNFLEAGAIPITENGTFLSYKKINENYKDCYTNSIDNSIGATVTMNRNHVNEDSAQTCSAGLHLCSYDYLPSYGVKPGARVVICEVHPKDVVSIPDDYNNTKMRVCAYVVIGEVEDYKEVDILSQKSVMTTSEVPQPTVIDTEDELIAHAKTLGKMISNRLDFDETTQDIIKSALAIIGVEDTVMNNMVYGSNKKIGKNISWAIRNRVFEVWSFEDALIEAQNNEHEISEEDEAFESDEEYCLKCGTTLIDGMDMCPSCGYNIIMVTNCVIAAKNLGKTIDGDLASGGSSVAVFKAFVDIGVDIYSLINTTLMTKLLSDNNIGHAIEDLIKRKIIDGEKFSVAYIDAKNSIKVTPVEEETCADYGNEMDNNSGVCDDCEEAEDENTCPRCGGEIDYDTTECSSCGYFILT